MVTGGGPTPDKPAVSFPPLAEPDRVSHELTMRVPDCRDWEIRAFFRYPDGRLPEISEAK